MPGILYHYRNEQENLNIVSGTVLSVMDRIEKDVGDDPSGRDHSWHRRDVGRIAVEVHPRPHIRSLEGNVRELQGSGLLGVDSSGATGDARRRSEDMFMRVRQEVGRPRRSAPGARNAGASSPNTKTASSGCSGKLVSQPSCTDRSRRGI